MTFDRERRGLPGGAAVRRPRGDRGRGRGEHHRSGEPRSAPSWRAHAKKFSRPPPSPPRPTRRETRRSSSVGDRGRLPHRRDQGKRRVAGPARRRRRGDGEQRPQPRSTVCRERMMTMVTSIGSITPSPMGIGFDDLGKAIAPLGVQSGEVERDTQPTRRAGPTRPWPKRNRAPRSTCCAPRQARMRDGALFDGAMAFLQATAGGKSSGVGAVLCGVKGTGDGLYGAAQKDDEASAKGFEAAASAARERRRRSARCDLQRRSARPVLPRP